MNLALFLICALYAPISTAVPFPLDSEPQKRSDAHRYFGTPGVNTTFDYIIVGGGTAGLTVASRLAENSACSVAVIEAGGFYQADDGNISVVPGYSGVYAGTDPKDTNPLIDWGFVTVPQAVCILVRSFGTSGVSLTP